MLYVYLLESVAGGRVYPDATEDLRIRFTKHDSGEVPHTARFKPWKLRTCMAFDDPDRALGLRDIPQDRIKARLCEASPLTRSTPALQ